MKSDLIDVEMKIHHTTERSILASTDGERDNAVWLPLAHIEVANKERGVAEVTMPEWLAVERGLA